MGRRIRVKTGKKPDLHLSSFWKNQALANRSENRSENNNNAERFGQQKDIDAVRNYLSKVQTSSDHLMALLNDMLEMEQIENALE